MKKIKVILMLFLLATIFSVNAYSMQPGNRNRPHQQGNSDKHKNSDKHRKKGTVRAPLDGGLLAVLGAAGVAYFVARKKKKDPGI